MALELLLVERVAKERTRMQKSTKDKIEGKAHELKGAIKEKIGKVTNDQNLEAEGTAEKVSGKLQKKVGSVEQVLDK
jgi:uncharacterized protein YjbJ (UPF0337 family)